MTGPPAEVSADESFVRGLLADQHPQYVGLTLRYCSEGWDNFTFRLGDDLAVRLPRRKAAAQLMLNEQRWLGELAPRLPVPIPAAVATGAPGRGFPWSWSIIPWIDGEPVDQSPLNASQGLVLAAFLRALHTPAPADAPANAVRGVALETRREQTAQRLNRLRASADLITGAVEEAWRDALAAPLCETPVWLHGDLHAQNVLSRDGALAGVIDWGDMCGGDPATDLSSVWTLLPDGSARMAALEAYGAGDALLARAKGWAIVLGAVLLETGRAGNLRHAAIGEATLRRLADDL